MSRPVALGHAVTKYIPALPKVAIGFWPASSYKDQRSNLELLAASRLAYLQSKLTRHHLEERLAIKHPEYSLEDYQRRLRRFYDEYFAALDLVRPSHEFWAGVEEHLVPGRVIDKAIPHAIYAATRDHANVSNSFSKWKQDHPSWKVEVLDEGERGASVRDAFAALGSKHAHGKSQHAASQGDAAHRSFVDDFLSLPYSILKIDTFRYLKLFLEGGIWSDGDAGSVYNVMEWPGMRGPEPAVVVHRQDDILRFLEAMPRLDAAKGEVASHSPFEDVWSGNTSGAALTRQRWTSPGLAIALEFDAPHTPKKMKNWREMSLSRPLQFAQYVFLAKRFHPVLLDCVGTIMAASALYRNRTLPTSTKGQEYTQLVLDWTGPGVFTDAVLRYLVARYGADPVKAISGLSNQAARIGDVLVYPEFSFQASMLEGNHSRFEMAHHDFLHSWIKE